MSKGWKPWRDVAIKTLSVRIQSLERTEAWQEEQLAKYKAFWEQVQHTLNISDPTGYKAVWDEEQALVRLQEIIQERYDLQATIDEADHYAD